MAVRLRSLLGLLVLLVAAAGTLSRAAAAPAVSIPPRDRVCMVQDTVMAVPAVPVELGGKTYFGCCEMCKGRIAGDPERYTLGTDPVTGKTVDKATAALLSVDGRVFYFESAGTRDRFASDPSRYARGAGADGR